jgi:hypothetical protein
LKCWRWSAWLSSLSQWIWKTLYCFSALFIFPFCWFGHFITAYLQFIGCLKVLNKVETYYSLVLTLSYVSTTPFPTQSPGRKVNNKFNHQLFSVCLDLTSSLRCLFILSISLRYFKNMWEILFFKLGIGRSDSRDLRSPLQISISILVFNIQDQQALKFTISSLL